MPLLGTKIDPFVRQITRLEGCCQRIEAQFVHGGLHVTDVLLIYTSSFVSACARWEALLEECLFTAVCGARSKRPGNFRHATFRSRARFRNVALYPNKDYFSFQSLKSTIEFASLFVNAGRPFSQISEANQTHLQQAMWIRNAIAHESDFAMRLFREKVPGVSSLPPNRRTPGHFLRFEFRTSPTQRRSELYFAAMKSAARELENSWV